MGGLHMQRQAGRANLMSLGKEGKRGSLSNRRSKGARF